VKLKIAEYAFFQGGCRDFVGVQTIPANRIANRNALRIAAAQEELVYGANQSAATDERHTEAHPFFF
jgi:hypothetical protein